MPGIEWIKAFHIIFMVTWFAGLFYLPRLFVYHASAQDEISLAGAAPERRSLVVPPPCRVLVRLAASLARLASHDAPASQQAAAAACRPLKRTAIECETYLGDRARCVLAER